MFFCPPRRSVELISSALQPRPEDIQEFPQTTDLTGAIMPPIMSSFSAASSSTASFLDLWVDQFFFKGVGVFQHPDPNTTAGRGGSAHRTAFLPKAKPEECAQSGDLVILRLQRSVY